MKPTSASAISRAADDAATAAAVASTNAATAASLASTNAQTAAKAASESATVIAVVANDVVWMKKSLIGIEETLSEMSKSYVTSTQHQEILEMVKDHEGRLRRIEDNMYKWMGVIAVVTFIVTTLGSFALKIILK